MENKPEITGLTQTQSPGRVGQFKTRLVKPLMRFLTMPYIRAQRILQFARTVDIFHMQSIYLARQALHLVILLNDSVDVSDGPDDEQYEERNDLEDELIELFDAMKNWGANHDDKEGISSGKRVLQIKQCYTVLFRERFYFQNSRDHSKDPTYQRLLAYDERTINFRGFQNHGPKSAPVDIAHPNSQLHSHNQLGGYYVDDHNDLRQKQRRNAIQPDVRPVTGQAGQRQLSKQQQQHPEHEEELLLRLRELCGSERIPVGQSVTTVPALLGGMPHSRRGFNTAAATRSSIINTNPPSSSTISGHIIRSRPKRRNIPDAPRHARRTSRSQSVLMATELRMDTNPMWSVHPLLDGCGMRYDPANMVVSETPAGHAPYAYDADRPHWTCMDLHQLGNYSFDPPAPPEAAGAGFSANSGRLTQGTGAASMSPYSTRPTIGLGGSLQQSPASTKADPDLHSQVYSHEQHGEYYGHIAPGSQYAQRFDYTHLAQPTDVDPMSANLQRHQHAEAIYTPDPHAQYYHFSHPHSTPLPRLPLRSSPQQAIYHQSYAAPNLAVNPFTTVDDPMNLNQIIYLPPQNHHLQSPFPSVSSPTEMSPERHSPTLQSRSRVPGQRVDGDEQMLGNSFRGNDDQSRVRREVLNDIQRQPWFHSNQDEPKMDVHLHREILRHGLGMVGRSIYTVFLVEDKDSNQWRCLFGSEEMLCKKTGKRFERVERAIEHVRSHLGHRPFACDGTCHNAKSAGTNCEKRFFGSGYLQDHKKRPQKRANVP